MAGLAFFPEIFRDPQGPFYQLNQKRGGEFQILTDFTSAENQEEKIRLAGEALASPASFRLDGKVVIISYLAGQHSPQYWRDLFIRICEAHGDHFIFLPAIDWFNGKSATHWLPALHSGTVTENDKTAIKEGLREWARATDGLYAASAANYAKDRRFDVKFYREFIIRNMKEVLAEPEFAGKKHLGLSACVGHENCTRFGYTLSSDGTATLRQSLEAALEAKPDLIVIPEWDEQNENTSLRPTVYNGRTAMRLLRHYNAQQRGQLQEPLPGDDTSVPNLILSFRKILTLGEPLALEVVAIPEHDVPEPKRVKIEVTNENGLLVYSSPEVEVEQGKLWSHRFEMPSEQFASSRYLVPALKVTDMNGERLFSEGMQVIDLRPSWNWDYKWVMQPLRELLVPKECVFEQTAAEEAIALQVKFEAEEPLAYVEVLDNDDVVYSHQLSDPMPRESADKVVFRIGWQSLEWKEHARRLRGSITLKGAEGQWQPHHSMQQEGQTIFLNGQTASIWDDRTFLSLSREQLAQAALEFDLPGIWQGDLPLERVYQSGIFGIPGPVGLNFVISRFVRQDAIPHHLNAQSVEFTIPAIPDLPRSRLHLQAIAVSGKIYRSRPFIAGQSSGKPMPLMVYSGTEGKPMKVQVDSSILPNIEYRFEPDATGSILLTDAGRPFWGILGGFSSQATGRGGGESRDGTPFLRPGDYPALITSSLPREYISDKASQSYETQVQSAPVWKKLPSGDHSLVFNGKSTFVTLPQGVIPRLASYEVTMELKPTHCEGRQVILSNRSFYPGSLSIVSDRGRIVAEFMNENATQEEVASTLVLQPDEWNTLTIGYDLSQITFTLNGKTSGPFPLKGPGLYDTVSAVGGYGEEWYAGEMKQLQIRHGMPAN